jgi:hypothetical protein
MLINNKYFSYKLYWHNHVMFNIVSSRLWRDKDTIKKLRFYKIFHVVVTSHNNCHELSTRTKESIFNLSPKRVALFKVLYMKHFIEWSINWCTGWFGLQKIPKFSTFLLIYYKFDLYLFIYQKLKTSLKLIYQSNI